MTISYNPLWKTLIDKEMKKGDLEDLAQISHNIMAKMGKNEHVSLQALEKICIALNCDISNVVAVLPLAEDENEQ